jgi:hypothetical protein
MFEALFSSSVEFEKTVRFILALAWGELEIGNRFPVVRS